MRKNTGVKAPHAFPMIIFLSATALLAIAVTPAIAQQGWWRTELQRADGHAIVFNFEWKQENGRDAWYIRNATERIAVKNITRKGDSLIVEMPVFESQFRVAYSKGLLQGVWIKAGAVKSQVMPFVARPGKERFPSGYTAGATEASSASTTGTSPSANIAGRWATTFISPGKPAELAVTELQQKGNMLTGTVLTPTGDYRYLEGLVRGDSMLLSCFDGGHAYLFMAIIKDGKTLQGGWFFSGAVGKQEWTAIKDDKAAIDLASSAMYLKPGQERLHFSFKDLEGKMVSIKDDRFKNKVVVIQIMGSWCPNCMDETAFLSEYYEKNKQRGVEIVALAYEYTTDWERSVKSLQKFKDRFKVTYPMLITGVSVTDTLRTEKTLPEVTRIKTFPSSIIIDKKGKVRKFDYGFNGPATGEHYAAYKKEFEDEINSLLKE